MGKMKPYSMRSTLSARRWLALLLAALLAISTFGAVADEAAPEAVEEGAKNEGLLSNPELQTQIDAAAAEAREVGWSELRIPLSVHNIGREFISDNALDVGQKLLDRGYQAYITGGAVRDMLLGKSVNDFDIATDAPLELWQELFGESLSLHGVEASDLQFGVVHYEGEAIDLAPISNVPVAFIGLPGTPEADPNVQVSDSPLYDSYGRDLTINALYYDLSTGDILDYHGGVRDIQDKVLRTINDPDTQLRNGPAEMIRYMRFLSRYEGSRFAPELEEALGAHRMEYAKLATPDNAQNQLRRLWVGGYAVACFDTMMKYDLLAYFYPPVAQLCATEAYQAEMREALGALDEAYAAGESITESRALAALLLPAVRERLGAMSAEEAVESVLTEMETVYGFYKDGRTWAAESLMERLGQEEDPAVDELPRAAAGFFDNEEINRLIDENHELVQANGYAELRIPRSLHGITEEAMTANSLEVGKKLLDNGFKAYVVGGCIRDFIMGKESNDIDISTNATPEEMEALFGDAYSAHSSGGRVFGGVRYPDELVDLATFQNIPAAYAQVPYIPDFDPTALTSDSELLDSFQRDLTMNAIYYDLSNGDLVDFHGGIHDIREHILETMVDADLSTASDVRIIIRAARFKARYGFDFSPKLEKAIREHGAERLATILQSDLFYTGSRMMVEGYGTESWHVLRDYGLLDTVYPSLDRLVDDADYADYLEKAMGYMDQQRKESGKESSYTLAMLVFLQPEIERRATRSSYETALHGVLDEQEMSFSLERIRDQAEATSALAHDMETVSSRFLREAILDADCFGDALALLNMKALTDSSLSKQVKFWNDAAAEKAAAEQADDEALEPAA